MRVLVTGSEGSLMQEVIPRLLVKGHTVVGVDNLSRHGRTDRCQGYELVEADLTDPETARRALRRVDVVLQSAGQVYGAVGFRERPADILGRDFVLHENVLRESIRQNVQKIAYVSSSMVYESVERIPTCESDLQHGAIPGTDYGFLKLACERLTMAYSKQYDLGYVIWRPFNIITPHEIADRTQGVRHVFADIIRFIVDERRDPIPVLGDGSQVRCFTWIDDVADAIANFSFSKATDNCIYNIGNPEPLTIRSLVSMIYAEAQGLGMLPRDYHPRLAYRRPPQDDVQKRIPDTTRIARDIGFRPSLSTRECIKLCLEVHRARAGHNIRQESSAHAATLAKSTISAAEGLREDHA